MQLGCNKDLLLLKQSTKPKQPARLAGGSGYSIFSGADRNGESVDYEAGDSSVE